MRPYGIAELVRTGRIAMVRNTPQRQDNGVGPQLHDSSLRKYFKQK
jgi:hypothetical protein